MRPRTPSLRTAVLGLIVCLAAALSVAVQGLHASAATGPPDLRPGLGQRDSQGGFVGYYLTRSGAKVYCLSPRKAVPLRLSTTTVRSYPGASAATSAALAYALSRWGDARTRSAASVESQVLNTLAGNTADVRRRAHGLPASLGRTVSAHVAEARAMRGPYVVRVSVPSALGPGQSGTGTVAVRTSGGRGLPGATVDLTHTANVVTARGVRTDAHGVARFRYTVVDVGPVGITATARALPALTMQVGHPKAGEQRMVGAGARTGARASTSFQRRAIGVSHRYECTTTCNGRPPVVLSACAPAATVAGRVVYRVGAVTVFANFPASRSRTCRSVTTTGRDGDLVTAAWQYRTSHGWSRPVAAPGRFVVDCPAPPPAGVTMSFGCVRGTVTIGLAQPGAGGSWLPFLNTSTHKMVLIVSGSRRANVYATAGQEAMWTTSAPCGSHLDLHFRAGVQRTGGGYNLGPEARVVTA